MTQDSGKDGNPDQGKAPNPNLLAGVMIFGAVLTAVIGALVPTLAEMTGPEATWIPFIFYAGAALEVILALWLRAVLLKARRRPRPGGQVIERQ